MTSMLLTDRSGCAPSGSLFGTVTRADPLLLRVSRGGLLDHRPDHVLVGRDPVGDQLPLLPVPLLELHGAAALVVEAGGLERLQQAVGAQLLDPLVVEV